MYDDRNVDVNMSVFSDNSVIQTPYSSNDTDRGPRRMIPVSTLDWQSSSATHMIPLNGLDFLRDVDRVTIQQTIELHDLNSYSEAEHRFVVKIPRGETIYYCSESSSSCERSCFGNLRPYTMRLFDHTQQEAMQFQRRLACGYCPFWCYRQKMEVTVPPGDVIGSVSQDFDFSRPRYSVYDKNDALIYKIVGPNSFGCLLEKNQNFQVYNFDGSSQVGAFINQWDQAQAEFNLLVQFPANQRETKGKALLLAAAFIIQYMYFQSSNKCCLCIC